MADLRDELNSFVVPFEFYYIQVLPFQELKFRFIKKKKSRAPTELLTPENRGIKSSPRQSAGSAFT